MCWLRPLRHVILPSHLLPNQTCGPQLPKRQVLHLPQRLPPSTGLFSRFCRDKAALGLYRTPDGTTGIPAHVPYASHVPEDHCHLNSPPFLSTISKQPTQQPSLSPSHSPTSPSSCPSPVIQRGNHALESTDLLLVP